MWGLPAVSGERGVCRRDVDRVRKEDIVMDERVVWLSEESLRSKAKAHRTYVGRQERGESGVKVDSLAAILAALDVSSKEFFRPFEEVMRLKTSRRWSSGRRGYLFLLATRALAMIAA